jgi:hypothetical protein
MSKRPASDSVSTQTATSIVAQQPAPKKAKTPLLKHVLITIVDTDSELPSDDAIEMWLLPISADDDSYVGRKVKKLLAQFDDLYEVDDEQEMKKGGAFFAQKWARRTSEAKKTKAGWLQRDDGGKRWKLEKGKCLEAIQQGAVLHRVVHLAYAYC